MVQGAAQLEQTLYRLGAKRGAALVDPEWGATGPGATRTSPTQGDVRPGLAPEPHVAAEADELRARVALVGGRRHTLYLLLPAVEQRQQHDEQRQKDDEADHYVVWQPV